MFMELFWLQKEVFQVKEYVFILGEVHEYASWPDIDLASIGLSVDNFRSDVIRSSTDILLE